MAEETKVSTPEQEERERVKAFWKYVENKLKQPFPAEDVHWRVGKSGTNFKGDPYVMALAYIDNRAILDRLDDTVGAGGWQNVYREITGNSKVGGGFLCGIEITCPIDGSTITKWDGANFTDFESIKGGLSDSMKRAGSAWGIGRYLYNLPTTYAEVGENVRGAKIKIDGKWYKWAKPQLPKGFLP